MTVSSSQDTRFRLDGAQARELAESYGTPLYVIGESHLRERIRAYIDAFKSAYANSEVTYASKANSTLAVLAIAAQEGCSLDVASEGELRAALSAGVSAERCHLHGNNKHRSEIEFALSVGIGKIVVDNFDEIQTLVDLRATVPLVLRLAPGVDPLTHAKISTGQADTKFGFNIADGSAEKAVVQCLNAKLNLVGFHCHVGSQLLDPEAQRSGGELIARFAVEMSERHKFRSTYLNVGGGLGVGYTPVDRPMDVRNYCRLVVEAIKAALGDSGLNPTLAQEPGRSLVAESGVTLYTVGVVKTVPTKAHGHRTYVCVDGGLSDNPRPALYGSHYDVERVATSASEWMYQTDGPGALAFAPSIEDKLVTVSGKHCETDKLFEDINLPANVSPGDILQVLCTGAYNASMASNYNRFPRPATALLREDGSHLLVQRRDTWEEMLAREFVPADLVGTSKEIA